MNSIHIGDNKFKFLAYSNSQIK